MAPQESSARRFTGAHVGSLIGCVGGLSFFLANSGRLAAPWPVVVRVLGVVLFVVCVTLVLRARVIGRGVEPSRAQLRAYGWTVVAEVAAIVVGARVLAGPFEKPTASLPWVAVVLGVHFVVFAAIFRERVFTVMGVPIVVLGLVGLVMAVADVDAAAIGLVSGVFTGAVMFAAVAWSAWVGRPGNVRVQGR